MKTVVLQISESVGSFASHTMLEQLSVVIMGLVWSSLVISPVNAEYYSSIDKMQLLAMVESDLVSATYLYLEQRQEQIDILRSFVDRVKLEHAEIRQESEQFEEHLEQPLQAFRLIKRLTLDWQEVHELLTTNQTKDEYAKAVNETSGAEGLPNQDELKGAVKGMLRLQRVYNLTAMELANNALLWNDCFEIGVQLYELAEFRGALEWLLLAANLLDQVGDDNVHQMSAEVYEYLALTYIELDEKQKAIETLKELLSWFSPDANHPARLMLDDLKDIVPKCPKELNDIYSSSNYSRLCQGKRFPEPDSNRNSLNCYFDFERHPRFRLSPLKVEQVHLNPDINVYYDVLNDAQINAIIDLADQRESFRSTILGNKVTDHRVSQQVWLDYSSPLMSGISKLVGAITGLNMNNAEIMQVANYGIGGQYIQHYDYFPKVSKAYIDRGNRITTNMFYLSDVLHGGYTVFPLLNVFLKPVKGALVSWPNLHRSLKTDGRTLHGGCPVLEGSKRIGNIWIRSAQQEFRRPCTLNSNE